MGTSNNEMRDDNPGSVPDIIRAKPVAQLPEGVQQAIELTRQYTQVSAELSAMQWGKGMSPVMRRAVSNYCERWGIDANTELDVLGGSFYINSEFYLRKLGELRRAGVIADFWYEHIHNDPRLKSIMDDTKFPEQMRQEARRRWGDMLMKRVEQNAPENATAVCVFYIQLPQGGHPIRGCKWAGGGTSVKQPRAGGGSAPNPIAESNAELSVESMAARRAARQIISHVGDRNVPNFDAMESELEALSAQVRPALERQAAIDSRLELEHHAPKAIAGSGVDGYGAGITTAQAEAQPVRTLSRHEIQDVAKREDPYGDDRPGKASEFVAAPVPLSAVREIERVGEEMAERHETEPAPAPTLRECGTCHKIVRVGEPSDHHPECRDYAD